jgi:dUTP pyrophosphatase
VTRTKTTTDEEEGTMEIRIEMIDSDPEFKAPRRAHPHDGAVDLSSREDFVLEPGERRIVPTGVKVAVPVGYGGFVVPRSGLAAKHGISVVNAPGLVDAGYRGEVKVILVNLGQEPVEFLRGERIAQLAFIPVLTWDLVVVDELDETARGDGGFGSSGRH